MFPVGKGRPAEAGAAQPVVEIPGTYLGQEAEAAIGYNEVEIVPGDIVVLVTDGLWRSVSKEELVENLLSAMNVQRSSSQLVRLAFSRDACDNATMTAWQYIVGGSAKCLREPKAVRGRGSREDEDAARPREFSSARAGAGAGGNLRGRLRVRLAHNRHLPQARQGEGEAGRAGQESDCTIEPAQVNMRRNPRRSQLRDPPSPSRRRLYTATVNGQGVRMAHHRRPERRSIVGPVSRTARAW